MLKVMDKKNLPMSHKSLKPHTASRPASQSVKREHIQPDTNYKKRILVVDDDPIIISLLKSRLEEDNFIVWSAIDGETSLSIIEEDMPDLIILDVMLPGMSGYEVCIKLKNNHKTYHIPILMLSCRCGDLDQKIGLDCGADAYVGKPYKSDELLSKIRNLLKINKDGSTWDENVLIVGENKKEFKIMKRLLIKMGFEKVHYAENGEEALLRINEVKPELLIVNMQLIDMNAYQLMASINRTKYDPKIIIVTEQAMDYERMHLGHGSAHADRYMQKTANFDELADIVMGIIAH